MSDIAHPPLTSHLFMRAACRRESASCVVSAFGEDHIRMPWQQVDDRSRRLWAALQRLGVRPQDRVATFGFNTHKHLELFFAVPSGGAVLHAINIRLFKEQILYVLRHAADKVLFVDASLTGVLAPLRGELQGIDHFVVMEDGWEPVAEFADAARYEDLISESQPAAFPDVDEASPAALCYTSGTTGSPKGVVYSHRSTVLQTMAALQVDSVGVSRSDTVMAVAPMFHAMAWGLPYAAALTGASLVLPGGSNDARHLARLIGQERVTRVSAALTVLTQISPLLDDGEHDFSSLDEVICGGSPLPQRLVARYREHGIRLAQGWGMTETFASGTISRQDGSTAINQGEPVPGMELRLCDEDGGELPSDGKVVGELEARSPWIVPGYYKPEADAANPSHDGWLRTGDLATIDPDGSLHIVDRAKDLVKSGGEWISSAELDRLLSTHPDIVDAAVIAVPHEKWVERPLAVVVCEQGSDVSTDGLRDFLADKVAKWWIPDRFEFVADLPRTSVGKVDKNVLRRRYQGVLTQTGG